MKINALIIEPDTTRRSLLRQAARALMDFAEVAMAQNISEGQQKCAGEYSFDLIFISFNLAEQGLTEFVRTLRRTKGGAHAACILVMKGQDQSTSDVIQYITQGVDGFLFEPYSVEGLRECVEIAIRVKCKQGKERIKLGLGVLLPQVLKGSEERTKEEDSTVSVGLAELKSIGKLLRELVLRTGESYEEVIATIFDELVRELPAYQGVSKRVREKFKSGTVVLEELKREFLAV